MHYCEQCNEIKNDLKALHSEKTTKHTAQNVDFTEKMEQLNVEAINVNNTK